MIIEPRPYRVDDLPRLLAMLGQCSAAADNLAVGMHPGDFAHHVTNTMRGADPADFFFVLDGAHGDPLAVVELSKHDYFDVAVHPGHRGGELEREILQWSTNAQKSLMARLNVEGATVAADGLSGDPVRDSLLASLGFTPAAAPFMAFTIRDLSIPNPAPALPDGFSIRPAAGVHEADAIGVVHSSAFKSNWTPGLYKKVMETPGFDIDREMLVVAPSGELAAFLIYWLDPVSRSGLFEPVGCAEAYQRRGLTTALMYHTLGLMRGAGMTRAIVKHMLDNPASTRAYESVGFVRAHVYTSWTRGIKTD